MAKKSKRAKIKQHNVEKTKNVASSITNISVSRKNVDNSNSIITSAKGVSAAKHQHIIPDLIRIGIIAAVIFATEIILSFVLQ
jgi:hypothetical protein